MLIPMKNLCYVALASLFSVLLAGCSQPVPPEINLRYEDNQSPGYYETIDAYRQLAAYYREASLIEMGQTDTGKPLHLFLISADRDFDPASIKRKGKSIMLINNGIHAGEPAGVDASIEYAMELLGNKAGSAKLLEQTVVAIIPVYNIGGMLNRSPYHRMNQDGPEYIGGRRNARNLDLNRDFVKQDASNARSFAALFHHLDPDLFIDTHTTNGMDHQTVMTLIPSMHQKLPPPMDRFFRDEMVPALYERMNTETPWGMIPYLSLVNRGDIMAGVAAFNDHAYYSSGYASLFNCFSFITETLVSKPYPERVKATLDFIRFAHEYMAMHSEQIIAMRAEARDYTRSAKQYVLDWTLDRDRHDMFLFKGYKQKQGNSPVTNRVVNIYDHEQPWADSLRFYNYFKPSLVVEAPKAYIIPQAWGEVISRMAINGVEINYLEQDTIIEAETIFMESYQLSPRSNQGRQMVSNMEIRKEVAPRQFYKGDAVISVNQFSNNYIVQMLEPDTPVSFLRWGFFNAALEAGEWFSIWSFENHAQKALEKDETLRHSFESRKKADAGFANDPQAQLQFLFDQMARPETITATNLYPVARIYDE